MHRFIFKFEKVFRFLYGSVFWIWNVSNNLTHRVIFNIKGNSYRLDRLVLRKAHDREPACWWVLDYKSALRPERQQELVQQLQQYQHILQTLYPDTPVRAAFVSADGRFLAVP